MASTSYKHSYPLENSNETKRLQNQHELYKDEMGGRLVLAPIDVKTSPLRILDSGTADGRLWHQQNTAVALFASSSSQAFVTLMIFRIRDFAN